MPAKILRNAALRPTRGLAQAMPATNADRIDADLLEFIKE
jgi:hypothetical protein